MPKHTSIRKEHQHRKMFLGINQKDIINIGCLIVEKLLKMFPHDMSYTTDNGPPYLLCSLPVSFCQILCTACLHLYNY